MFIVSYVEGETIIDGPYVYNGAEQSVSVTATDVVTVPVAPETYEGHGVIDLIDDTDWEVADGSDTATNAGEYTVTVTAKEGGNYSGTVQLTDQKWTIDQKSIDDETVTVTVTDAPFTYDGTDKDITEKIVVTDTAILDEEEKPVVLGSDDYEIISEASADYLDADALVQKNAATYTFYVKAKENGNYKNSQCAEWTIEQAEATIKISGRKSFVYDGQPVDTKFTAKIVEKDTTFDEVVFVWGTPDAQTAGAYNLLEEGKVPVNAGKYAVKATTDGNGNYKDSESAWYPFEITKRQIELYPHEGQSSQFGDNISITCDVEEAAEDTVTGLVAGDDAGDLNFSSALKLDTGDLLYEGDIPVGFYPIVVDPTVEFDNYTPVCDGSVDYEITKKQLTDDMFQLVLFNGEEEQQGTEADFSSDKYRVEVRLTEKGVNEGLTLNDVTITGTTEAYLPAEGGYKVTITAKDTSSFGGKVELPWNINSVDLDAVLVIEGHNESSGTYHSNYYYNGKTPDITIEGDLIPGQTHENLPSPKREMV